MGTLVKGTAYRSLAFGPSVVRPASVVPQTGTGTLFTVAGGRVLVTGITGIIAVAGSSTDAALQLNTLPTVGSTAPMHAAMAATTSYPAGGIFSVDGNPATAMTLNVGVGQISDSGGIIVPAGLIRLTTTASNATLSIQWTLLYVPLDDGANVVAS